MTKLGLENVIRDWLPDSVHTLGISVWNYLQYRRRHGGEFGYWHDYFNDWHFRPAKDWKKEQLKRLLDFLDYSKENSPFYSKRLKGIEFKTIQDLCQIPILTKNELLEHFDQICTISPSNGIKSETGGTTGNSMTIYFTPENMQERFGLLKSFRGEYGYQLGEKSVWFSGKELLSRRNVKKGKYYKDDLIQRIRYFSTFHLTEKTFNAYWSDFNEFSPKYIFGFPSTVVDFCNFAKQRGYKLDQTVVAFFSTSEVVSEGDRELVRDVMGCPIADQYASAEGAPFILDCNAGNKHIHPLTGIFEIVDENMEPSEEGEILVTSFTTYGTPLIRYRIGDRISMADNQHCDCGCSFPIIESLDGRNQDCIYSVDGARISAVNISNCSKHISGINRFQVVQGSRDSVTVNVSSSSSFTQYQQEHFIEALKQRLGNSMKINLELVDEIPRSASGKFRVVINKINDIG